MYKVKLEIKLQPVVVYIEYKLYLNHETLWAFSHDGVCPHFCTFSCLDVYFILPPFCSGSSWPLSALLH